MTKLQEQKKQWTPVRVMMALIGVIITGVSIGMFQKAEMGTDPFTAFVTGIANVFSSGYGTFYPIIVAILLVGVALLQRRYIGVATILNLFLCGVAADWTKKLLDHWMGDIVLWQKLILLAVTLLLACLSASLYFTADLGVSGYDAWALMAANEYHLAPFRLCRVVLDVVCVSVGFFLGATVGIGTVLQALCMGPVVQWFNTHLSEPLVAAPAKRL